MAPKKVEDPRLAAFLIELSYRDDCSDEQVKSYEAVKRHAKGLATEVLKNVPNVVESATILGELKRSCMACYSAIDKRYHGKAMKQQEDLEADAEADAEE